jgi:hydrogenase expression/formation protein HypE
MTDRLVRDVFLAAFDDPTLGRLEDQATLPPPPPGARVAVTTDAFVVRPIEFPGGDVGTLAVCGTVNDLVVGGAIPTAITAAFILEEGTPLELVARVAQSMAAAARSVPVAIVAGDTKVVERGHGDGVFVVTTGVGHVPAGRSFSIGAARPGDAILVSGPIGDHGIAVLSVRDGLAFETSLISDVAQLHGLVEALLGSCPEVRSMRDPTRGGLAGVVVDLAEASRCGVLLDERAIPVRDATRAACELLGLDVLFVACEGRLVAVVPDEAAERALEALRAHPLGAGAAIVGRAVGEHPGRVSMRVTTGARRWVSRLAGEQLPRIC